MKMRGINFNVLKIRDAFFGNKETLRTFLHPGHDTFPLLQDSDEYGFL
jgi:hypothetical protein